MKYLFLILVSGLIYAQNPVVPDVRLVIPQRVVAPGQFARIDVWAESNLPVRGLELQVIYAAPFRRHPNHWVYQPFNGQRVEYGDEDTLRLSFVNYDEPFSGRFNLGKLAFTVSEFATPWDLFPLNMQLKVVVRVGDKDTLVYAKYEMGYIRIGSRVSFYGDADSDKVVSLFDAIRSLDMANSGAYTTEDLLRLDVNGDGYLNSYDSYLIQIRSINPRFVFEVQGSGYVGKGRVVRPSGINLRETPAGVYVSFAKNDSSITNGDLEISAPGVTAEVAGVLKNGMIRLSEKDGKIRLNFIGGETGVPTEENVIFLRGAKASEVKIGGTINEGIPLLPKIEKTTAVETDKRITPEGFALQQNYPNPFNPETVISFDLPAASRVRLNIYSVLGELVANLADGEYSAGRHALQFNGGRLASGIYFYRLETDQFSKTMKMMLAK